MVYLICWYVVIFAIHQDLICQSQYSQSQCLLPSSSANISFSNTLLISETTFYFTGKTSIAFCLTMQLKLLKVFLLGFYTWCKTLQVIIKNFPGRISQQEFLARLVTLTNEPVTTPSTTSFAFSQAKYFFASTNWKYGWSPIWLKTLNRKGYAVEYWYQKSLDVVHPSETGMSQTQVIKTFSAKNECNGINFGVVTKFKFNCQVSPGLIQPFNRVASTTTCSLFSFLFYW